MEQLALATVEHLLCQGMTAFLEVPDGLDVPSQVLIVISWRTYSDLKIRRLHLATLEPKPEPASLVESWEAVNALLPRVDLPEVL
ncbi:hypothetical protein ACFXJ8_40530 [Nonomuraea sp. NPDC059194]|uniref:hypothetical protein n=1 Tax=Nonomuraea sp. NPDC059194 TaxID=3346764 RepID=UPI0036D0A114